MKTLKFLFLTLISVLMINSVQAQDTLKYGRDYEIVEYTTGSPSGIKLEQIVVNTAISLIFSKPINLNETSLFENIKLIGYRYDSIINKNIKNKMIMNIIFSNTEILPILTGLENIREIILFPRSGYKFILISKPNNMYNNIFNEGVKSCQNGLKTYSNNENVLIYPNPTTGQITIEGVVVKKVELLNAEGALIGEYTTNIIDISNQASGLYMLNVFDSNGLVKTEKITLTK